MLGRGLAGRTPGYSLDAEGRAEARTLAVSMAKLPIAAIISSPRERARETVAPLAERLGLTIAIEPRFDEIDFGAWTGRSFDSLHDVPAWRAWNEFRSTAAIPGGETMLSAQARAVAAALAVPEGEVVIVTHGDIVKALLAHFLGIPLDLLRRMDIAPASRSVLRIYDRDARIEAINLPPHA